MTRAVVRRRPTETRPSHVHCAALSAASGNPPSAPVQKTWCGRTPKGEWVFSDANHALSMARENGRLMLCTDCSKAIKETLKAVSYGARRAAYGASPKKGSGE